MIGIPDSKLLLSLPQLVQRVQNPLGAQTWRSMFEQERLRSPRFPIIFNQTFRHSIGILAKNAFSLDTFDIASAFVVAGLNPIEYFLIVHDVRLAINNRTSV